MSAHQFTTSVKDDLCVRCRAITRPDYWLERDIYGVVRPCVGSPR